MAWTSALTDARAFLSDGPLDKYNFRKRCFGEINGTNDAFKTFDTRRVTDFTTSTFPQTIFKNGTSIPATGVSADYPISGEFILSSSYIPIDGDIIEASYYFQWFIDDEIVSFLQDASRWLASSIDYTNTIPDGLVPAALNYMASLAFTKISQRWKLFMSDMYKVEDAPHDNPNARVDDFIDLAKSYREIAVKLKVEFFTRQGRALQPLFGTVIGNVRPLP